MFDIQLFGRVEVRTRGVLLAGHDFGGDRPRLLFALLALRGPQSVAELASATDARKKDVEHDLDTLRAHLEPGVTARDAVLTVHRGRWQLDPERVRVDVARFDELIALAAARTPERAERPLRAAAFLASRPLLEDEDVPWAAEARAEYRAKLVLNAYALKQ